MSVSLTIDRTEAPIGHAPNRVPLIDDDGLVTIDPWWGTIQPQQLHPGIPTWGELEVIDHIAAGGRLIDTRLPEYVAASGTIPGSLVIPWETITDHLDAIEPGAVTVLFCNGPQCAATPRAVGRLLDSGVEPESLAYYRGGIQDWVGLGLPTIAAPNKIPG
ncbi:MAG: rhodanese-like domain-containing protein [Solirubrobacterales bacterium]|nr:rhodanese-like domain-containing protein [Solirubrobacterales bacterium]